MSKDGLHNDTSLPSSAANTEEHSATSDNLEKTEVAATRLQNRDLFNKVPEQSSGPDPIASPKSRLKSHPWLQAHLRGLIVLGIATVILLSMITISSIRATDKPSLNQVSSDIANLSEAPAYDPGDFGRDATLTLDSVDYSEVIRNEDHCNATGAVIYAGDGIAAREKVSLLYDHHSHGKWSATGDLIIQEVSWSASKGPDTNKVLTQARVFYSAQILPNVKLPKQTRNLTRQTLLLQSKTRFILSIAMRTARYSKKNSTPRPTTPQLCWLFPTRTVFPNASASSLSSFISHQKQASGTSNPAHQMQMHERPATLRL